MRREENQVWKLILKTDVEIYEIGQVLGLQIKLESLSVTLENNLGLNLCVVSTTYYIVMILNSKISRKKYLLGLQLELWLRQQQCKITKKISQRQFLGYRTTRSLGNELPEDET